MNSHAACWPYLIATRCRSLVFLFRMACACWVAMVLLASLGCSSRHRAEAWLRHEEVTILEPAPQSLEERRQIAEEFFENQSALVLSPLVLEQVLARPDIATIASLSRVKHPVKKLQENLTFERQGKGEVFVIGCTWTDPHEAATIANAVVEAYFRMHTQDEAQRSTRVVELMEDERARRMVVIQQLKNLLQEIEKRTSTKLNQSQPDLVRSALRASYLKLRTQHDHVALELAELEVAQEEQPAAEAVTGSSPEPTATRPTTKPSEQVQLERQLKAIALREARVLAELDRYNPAELQANDLRWKKAELKREEEVLEQISERIMKLRTEMTAPAKVTLLRRAEPSD